jgi:hypothetical protein
MVEFDFPSGPTEDIDPAFDSFLLSNGFDRTDRDGFPSRSLRWQSQGIERLIQIWHDEEKGGWLFWLCASKDVKKMRHWKSAFLKEGVPLQELKNDAERLLNEGRRLVESWTEADLKPAGSIR